MCVVVRVCIYKSVFTVQMCDKDLLVPSSERPPFSHSFSRSRVCTLCPYLSLSSSELLFVAVITKETFFFFQIKLVCDMLVLNPVPPTSLS